MAKKDNKHEIIIKIEGASWETALDKAFKETITGMLTEFGRRKEELRKNFNKDLENIRKNKSELKNTRTEIKNILEGINSN